jgi:hypothetical protein
MKNIEGWDESRNGTNKSGFCGLPGGSRFDDGDFFGGGRNGEVFLKRIQMKARFVYYTIGLTK